MPLRLLALLTLCLAACKQSPPADFQPIQDSAPGAARVSVAFNRINAGLYRAIAPNCIGQRYIVSTPDAGTSDGGTSDGGTSDGGTAGGGLFEPAGGLLMNPGQIVEFRNYQPTVPTNVTSLSAPAPLFSPNLVKPYNIRIEGKEEYSFWRYVFPVAGVYEYFDTNMGTPGRQVVDSYYGTVSYVGESSAPRGVVCVDPPACVVSAACLAGTAPEGTVCCTCPGVCCDEARHCAAPNNNCHRGRCVNPETLDLPTP